MWLLTHAAIAEVIVNGNPDGVGKSRRVSASGKVGGVRNRSTLRGLRRGGQERLLFHELSLAEDWWASPMESAEGLLGEP